MAAASPQTPASPATTATTERPEGIPDSYWDPEAKALKVDPVALAKDLKERDGLKVRVAAEDVRKATLPDAPKDYKASLPADFKMPDGVAPFTFDESDPLLAQARDLAHAQGRTQDEFSQWVALYAADKIGADARIADARKAEIGKLGATATARVDNATQWLTGIDGTSDKRHAAALAEMMVAARHVEAIEYLITKTTSQGSAAFSQQHRVAPDDKEIPGFKDMSFAQQRQAQDQLRARKSA